VPGQAVLFSTEALNASGAILKDESAAFDWDAEDREITNDGVFQETAAGEYDVTATINGVESEPTTVEVVTGPVQSVAIDPSVGQSVNPGEVLEFSAEAFDGDGFLVEDDDEAFGRDAEGGTLEYPNAGTDGNASDRSTGAVNEAPLMISADNITVDGFEIRDTNANSGGDLPGPGTIQIAVGGAYADTADNATVRNNVILLALIITVLMSEWSTARVPLARP
jgi:hypothetical protein